MEILDAIWIYDKDKEATIVRYADAKKRRRSMVTDVPPYFFIKRGDKDRLMEFNAPMLKKIRGVYDNSDYSSFDGIPAIKIEVDMPTSVRYLRDGLEKKGVVTFESDTPYVKRWMIDGGHTQCPIDSIVYADIEADGREKWGTPKNPCQQILSMSLIDNKGEKTFISDNNEKMLIQETLRLLMKKYQVITGWYFNDYDWPYFLARMEFLNLKKPFVPIQRLDLLTAYKRFILPTIRSEKVKVGLDDCGLRHLGEGKACAYNAFKLWDSFQSDKSHLQTYNMQDAVLCKKLNEKLHLLDPYFHSAKDFPLSLTELERMSYVWESLLMRECQTRNPRLVIPRKQKSASTENANLRGGNILPTVPGYHANVIEMDFKGLYPSMMRLLGISPEYVYSWELDVINRYGNNTPWGNNPSALTIDLNAVSDYASFVKRTVSQENRQEPMFRKVLGRMQDLRDTARKMRDEFPEDSEEHKYWDARQLFYKTVLVSSYGVSGLKSGKFFMPNFVNLLTFTTRSTIQAAASFFEARKWMVTYGHTDSAIVRRADNDLDTMEVIKITKPLGQEINSEVRSWLNKTVGAEESLLPIVSMQPAKVAVNMLLTSARTKRIMDVVWTEGHFGAYRLVTGAEYKRVDVYPLLGKVQMDVTDMVFRNKNIYLSKELEDYLADLRENLYSGNLDKELVISKTLSEEPDKYATKPPHVRVAERLQKEGKYRHGEKVNYVVVSQVKGKQIPVPVIEGEEFPRIDSSGYGYYYDSIKRLIERTVIYETSEQTEMSKWECSS